MFSLHRSALSFYRRLLSPLLHLLMGPSGGCRFEPTCSVYLEEAIEAHGWLSGSRLFLGRLSRCHPFSRSSGHDPVPHER